MAYVTDNQGNKILLSQEKVAREIRHHLNLTQDEWVEWYDGDTLYDTPDQDEDGNYTDEALSRCYFPIRLQVVDGDWFIHSGDPSFDVDHRGAWGESYGFYGMGKGQLKELAKELIQEAQDF
jgi:hypothetical protein